MRSFQQGFASIFLLIGLLLLIAAVVVVFAIPKSGPPPTEQSVKETNSEQPSFSRNYPSIIKGNWEPGGDFLNRIFDFHTEEIKELGVNTVSIVPGYVY